MFDFESELASAIRSEELFGYMDGGEIGNGLFSNSPLTSPDPTPPPSPAQRSTALEGQDLPPVCSLSPPDSQQMLGSSSSKVTDPAGEAKKVGRRYVSNKKRSHGKRKRERVNERKEREAGGQPYNVRASTRLKHVRQSNAVDAAVNLADIPISAPGYIGLCTPGEQDDRVQYTLDGLVGPDSCFKFKLQKWDGR